MVIFDKPAAEGYTLERELQRQQLWLQLSQTTDATVMEVAQRWAEAMEFFANESRRQVRFSAPEAWLAIRAHPDLMPAAVRVLEHTWYLGASLASWARRTGIL